MGEMIPCKKPSKKPARLEFKQFVKLCQTQNKVPTRLKQAAQLLDKENF